MSAMNPCCWHKPSFGRIGLPVTLALLCLLGVAPSIGRAGEAAVSDPAAQLLRISRQRPPCSAPPAGLPVTPNDPATLVTGRGVRCYGTSPEVLQLWLHEDRYAWLQRPVGNPAVWIRLGPVVVDPLSLEPPPLGLRLSRANGTWLLETRYGDSATLTPLRDRTWTRVEGPGGERFWVQRGAPEPQARPVSGDRDRIRFRAD